MDTIIMAAALLSFLALIAAWLALPASGMETAAVLAHGAPARA
jgi:hypothetical protein